MDPRSARLAKVSPTIPSSLRWELRALEMWSVRAATVPDGKVTDCGSHVKRVDALSLALSEQDWQPGAHVLLCSVCILSVQMPFMMSLTILPSLRRSCAVGQASPCGLPREACRDQGRVAKSRTRSSLLLGWASVCVLPVQPPFMMSLTILSSLRRS